MFTVENPFAFSKIPMDPNLVFYSISHEPVSDVRDEMDLSNTSRIGMIFALHQKVDKYRFIDHVEIHPILEMGKYMWNCRSF
jgi:hypothetical protein